MRDLDPVLDELTGNKLELVDLLLDEFLKEISILIHAKLGRSRMTGLMAPIMLFMPFQFIKHPWVLTQGYEGSVNNQKCRENYS